MADTDTAPDPTKPPQDPQVAAYLASRVDPTSTAMPTGPTPEPAKQPLPDLRETMTGVEAEQRSILEAQKAETARNRDELAKARQHQMDVISSMPTGVRPPNLQNIPQPPQQKYSDVFQKGAPGLIFATVMGSLFARNHGMGAMAAAGSYMEGYRKGDEEQMALARQNWENKVKAIKDQNQVESERYSAIYNNAKMSMVQKEAMANAYAASVQDVTTQQAWATGNAGLAMKIPEDRLHATEKLWEQQIKWGGLGGGMSERAVQMAAAKAIEQGGKIDASMFRGAQGAVDRRRVWEAVTDMADKMGLSGADLARIGQNFNAEGAGQSAAARARAGAEPRADAAALTQLRKQQSAIRSFEQTAIANGEVLAQLAEKVDRTGVPVFERWMRAGRQAVAGDDDVTAFNFQYRAYISEVGRIIAQPNMAGVLSDTARREMQEALPNASSAKQIRRVIGLAKSDMQRRETAIENEIRVVQGRLGGSGGETPTPEPSAPAPAAGGAVPPPPPGFIMR